jgi:hypothetical protein
MDGVKKIFSIQEVVDFLRWADERYMFSGVLASDDDERIIELIKEYLEGKSNK